MDINASTISAPLPSAAPLLSAIRSLFKTRELIFHDGQKLRRLSVAGRTQALFAGIASVTLCFSAYGVGHAALSAATISGIVSSQDSTDAQVMRMQAKLAAMQADVAAIRQVAKAHAARVDQRQALIAAAVTGKGNPTLAAASAIDGDAAKLPDDIVAPFVRIETRQVAMAVAARRVAEQRYAKTARQLRRLGLSPDRFASRSRAMGGPMIAANSAEAAADINADVQFRSLFTTWKKLDSLEQGVIAIPAIQPVAQMSFTSDYGVRSDPFRGTAAMHAGVDIPGRIGTPIYATADGLVERAERSGGYGNLVEINHGKGIQTRYGHLSKMLVAPNTRVKRGQLIALMGSTGRSTGSHLHYEVRIDGSAVNPRPFLQTANYLLSVQDRQSQMTRASVGGPAN